MTTHPNRSRGRSNRAKSSNPLPEMITSDRYSFQLTQAQAAKLIYATVRTWQDWEAGRRRMHPALYELFVLKASAVAGDPEIEVVLREGTGAVAWTRRISRRSYGGSSSD